MQLERKVVSAEFKADVAKRRIEGYASTFGNVDGNDDIVLKGAYTRTLENDLPIGRIKVKRNHQVLIGKPEHAEQDSKGLLTVSRISDTDLGNETLILVQDGVIDEMSIGFKAEEKSYTTVEGKRVRELAGVKLYEWSFMDDVAANSQASVIGVKSLYDVSCVLDQMQSAVYALQRLASLPADVAARVAALVRDLQALPSVSGDAEYDARQAAQVASLSTLLSEFTNSLRTTNS
ncbi:MAG TPA: HK97 family phage prohead protease [Gemmatimonadaceae bacterium]|nr:HK97 family phage prohead protease [Gemmatimonadaceae bacterium]